MSRSARRCASSRKPTASVVAFQSKTGVSPSLTRYALRRERHLVSLRLRGDPHDGLGALLLPCRRVDGGARVGRRGGRPRGQARTPRRDPDRAGSPTEDHIGGVGRQGRYDSSLGSGREAPGVTTMSPSGSLGLAVVEAGCAVAVTSGSGGWAEASGASTALLAPGPPPRRRASSAIGLKILRDAERWDLFFNRICPPCTRT